MEPKHKDTKSDGFRATSCKNVLQLSSKKERGDYKSTEFSRAKPSPKHLRNTPQKRNPRISIRTYESNPTMREPFLTSDSNPTARKHTESTLKVRETEMKKGTFLSQLLMKIITGCMERGQDINPLLDFLKNKLSESSTRGQFDVEENFEESKTIDRKLSETSKPGQGVVEDSSEESETLYRRGYSAATWVEIRSVESQQKASMLSVITSAGTVSLPEQGVDMVDVMLRGGNVFLPTCDRPGMDDHEEQTKEEQQTISDRKAMKKRTSRPKRPSIEPQVDVKYKYESRSFQEKSSESQFTDNSLKEKSRTFLEKFRSLPEKSSSLQEKSIESQYTDNSLKEKSRSFLEKFRSLPEKSKESPFTDNLLKDKRRRFKEKSRSSLEKLRSLPEKFIDIPYTEKSLKDKTRSHQMKSRSLQEKSRSRKEKCIAPPCTDNSLTEKTRSHLEKSRSLQEKSRIRKKKYIESPCTDNSLTEKTKSHQEKSRSLQEKPSEPPSKNEWLRFTVFNSKCDREYAERCEEEDKLARCI